MALNDLTPQLRTRLSRVERAVGLFVSFAVVLLIAGFLYYLYHTAQRKGWFLHKVPYFTFIQTASGLKVGDPVKMMGFEVGEITEIEATPPDDWFVQYHYNVFVQFKIREPYYGYIWTDSVVKVTPGDLWGNRELSVTKGVMGEKTVQVSESDEPVEFRNPDQNAEKIWLALEPGSKGFLIDSDESPALTERLEVIANKVEKALPGLLSLTNQVATMASNGNTLFLNLNSMVSNTQPIVANLSHITSQIKNPSGGLGEWLFPTNLNRELNLTLTQTRDSLQVANEDLSRVSDRISVALTEISNLASNLNAQVQANSNILSEISRVVVSAHELAQGLKRHWFLRSAFDEEVKVPERVDPKGGAQRLQSR